MPSRRSFLNTLTALASARGLLQAAGVEKSRIGMCSFSCHQHWQSVRQKEPGTKFTDARSFYDYARTLGAGGVQTSVAALDESQARSLQEHIAETGGYYEGDLRLPQGESGLVEFEREVKLARATGATVARTVLTGSRRYEFFKTMEQFREF